MNINKKWTEEQIKLLKENYAEMPWNELMLLLDIDKKQRIADKACSLGLKRLNYRWNKNDINFLKENFEKMTYKEIGIKLGRTESSVNTKINDLKLQKSIKWSKKEIKILKDNYENMSNTNIAKLLNGRNRDTVQEMAKKLGLKKGKFTLYELDNVKNHLLNFKEKTGRTPLFEEIKDETWCPSALSFSRYYGGYRKFCLDIGLDVNQSVFGKKRYMLKSKNNDLCLSHAEQVITNFFIDNKINYKKEVPYSKFVGEIKNEKFCDWVINGNVLVEFFGLMNKDFYIKKVNEKRELVKKHNLNFIELIDKDLSKLKVIFKDYII